MARHIHVHLHTTRDAWDPQAEAKLHMLQQTAGRLGERPLRKMLVEAQSGHPMLRGYGAEYNSQLVEWIKKELRQRYGHDTATRDATVEYKGAQIELNARPDVAKRTIMVRTKSAGPFSGREGLHRINGAYYYSLEEAKRAIENNQ